jgi:hypothetical protein
MRGLNNAYMLVYIRAADWDTVMADVGKEAIDERVRAILERQLAEKLERRRKKMQAHRFVQFRGVTFEQMQGHVRPQPAAGLCARSGFAGCTLGRWCGDTCTGAPCNDLAHVDATWLPWLPSHVRPICRWRAIRST